MRKFILLADMESFYASVEIAREPSLKGKPVVVCSDPKKRHGITLAATKEAKRFGIKTGMPAWKCRSLCPEVVFVRPHMNMYIDMSLKITKIFEQFTDRVFPYSIDEQFLDMTGCEALFGSPVEMALQINKKISEDLQIRCRIGIGENPLQAKMACDNFAKKNTDGIFELNSKNYPRYVWSLPIKNLFGVGSRMDKNLKQIGIYTIGHLARHSRKDLQKRWGVFGELLWLNAHGIDYSIINPSLTESSNKGVGHSITLPKDYTSREEIKVILLELCEEVCFRTRALGKASSVVKLYCKGADFNNPSIISRQKKLANPTTNTMDIYDTALNLFDIYWDRNPIRVIGLSLSQLKNQTPLQLSIFDKKEKNIRLYSAIDNIRKQFGKTSLFRATSLTSGSQLFERATKIGGHEG